MIDNYKDLPIGAYMDICQISKDASMDELDKQVRIISILSGLSEDEVLHLPIPKYKEMVTASSFLERIDTNRHQAAHLYILGKWNLQPTKDYRKMETAQYVDFQTYAPDVETKLPELLSCLLVPVGHRYNEGYDILDVQAAIRTNMSTTDALALSAFFLTKYKKLIAASLSYCKREVERLPKGARRTSMMKEIVTLRAILEVNGAGSQTLTQ